MAQDYISLGYFQQGDLTMKRLFLILIICILPSALFSQNQNAAQPAETKKADDRKKDAFPPQSVQNEDFVVSMPSFVRKGDNLGKGEILEVGFDITNNLDSPRTFYIFVIATYEDIKWQYNSFQSKKTFPEKVQTAYFSPYPDTNANYEYEINGEKELKRYPKDFKAGINPADGKFYTLKDKLIIRSNHLCIYRKNYKYYNNVTIILYDEEGKLKFRQTYALEGSRH